MKVINITEVMIKLQFKLPQALISRGFTRNLKNQWKNLGENWKRCLVRREQQMKSGAEAQNLATCKFFKLLVFIHDKVMNKKTHSNMSLDIASNMEREDNAPFNNSLASPPSQSLPSPQNRSLPSPEYQ